MEKEREIIEIIKRDDLTSFRAIFQKEKLLNLSFGRFPILSLCYLYNAKKIVKNYEKKFIKINQYNRITEPFFIYKDFRNFAKKSIRLYQSENSIVSPFEMMAILHLDRKLESISKYAVISDETKKNISKIYESFYNQDISFKKEKIKVGFKIISNEEKSFLKRCLLVCAIFIFVLLGAMTAVEFSFGGIVSKAKVFTSSQFVSAISSSSSAMLQNDINLSNIDISNTFTGEFDGNGHTIYVDFSGKSLIDNNAGTIKNLKIIYRNFSEETTISSSSSLLCNSNSGSIYNVEISFVKTDINEKININLSKKLDGSFFCGFAVSNSGIIEDCKIVMSVSISGTGNGDGNVSGIAGENSGKILNCLVLNNSVIESLDIDISGVVANNKENGLVQGCINNANLSQTSEQDNWSPTVAGVVGINNGEVVECRNNGELGINSTFDGETSNLAVCGGVVSSNYAKIKDCKNSGNIEITTNTLSVYCGGIVGYNSSNLSIVSLQGCGQESEISVVTAGENAKAYVGGIGGFFFGQLSDCFSISTFTTPFDESKNYVGSSFGLVLYSNYFLSIVQHINGNNNSVLITANAQAQIGVMMLYYNNSIYTSNNMLGQETGTNSSTNNQVVISYSESQDIKDLEVYFE